jgi:hypothetical protein
MDNREIAKTILDQLGGNKFIAMTGSKHFIALDDGLRMNLSRNKTIANRLEITLTPDDDYTMRFYQLVKKSFDYQVKEVKRLDVVYFDNLQTVFTEVTGLYAKF